MSIDTALTQDSESELSVTPLILIIDDDPQSLRLLNHALSEAGFRVAVANGGDVAFKVLAKRLPDLILCDVIMPEIDGYEVCRRLKAEPDHRDIPLIFLTSRTDPDDLLAGFEAGAVDYVTKPFSSGELLARVRTHTELKRARDTILDYAHQLEALNGQLKTMNTEKNHILGIVAHDLKNPLTTIMMSAEMVEERVHKVTPASLTEYMQMIRRNVDRIRTIITNLLDASRIDSGKLAVDFKPFELCEFATRLVEQYRDKATRKQISLNLELPSELIQVVSDENLLYQIADNLLSNALKYSPSERQVCFAISADAEHFQLVVRDQGPGFSRQDQLSMFQKFTRLSAQPTAGESSTGLGLSIVKRLTELLEGQIDCQSESGQGAIFTVSLPRHTGP